MCYVAVGHSMLIIIYNMLKDGAHFQDLGAEYYNHFKISQKDESIGVAIAYCHS